MRRVYPAGSGVRGMRMRFISLFVSNAGETTRAPNLIAERSAPASVFTPTCFQRWRQILIRRTAIGGVVFAVGANALPALVADGSIATPPELVRVAFPMLAADRPMATASMMPTFAAAPDPVAVSAPREPLRPVQDDPILPTVDAAPVDLSDVTGEPIAGVIPQPRPRPETADRAPTKVAHQHNRERRNRAYARNQEQRDGMGYGRNYERPRPTGLFSFLMQ